MKGLTKNIGMALLALWLIATALNELGILRAIPGLGTLMAVLALAAGILILAGR